MKTSFLAIVAAVAGLAIADNIDLPDCAKGCLDDDLQKTGCTQDNISDCYCGKANVNSLVTCVSNNCKDQNDLLKAAQGAQKACPNGAGGFNFNNGIPGFNNGGGGNNNGGGGQNGGGGNGGGGQNGGGNGGGGGGGNGGGNGGNKGN